MTDELVPADPVVRTALQLLPVPDHDDAFWARLDATLAQEPAPGVARREPLRAVAPGRAADRAGTSRQPTTVPLVELEARPAHGVVPPAMRRRSNVVLSAIAVAAAVVVVVAGTSLVRSRTGDDADTDAADAPEATVEGETTSSVSTLTAPDDEPAVAAVVAWVNALAGGDMEAAWDALGPASQAHWGSMSAFAAERSGLAEGFGAWSTGTPDDVVLTSLRTTGDDELVVVTLIGTVDQEGSRVSRADAFPVRLTGEDAVIELYAYAGELEIVVPEPADQGHARPTVASGDELVVVVPEGVPAPVLRLDDGEILVCGEAPGTELTVLEGASGQRCGYAPEGGIPAGERVLTVAFSTPDGRSVTARSVRFQAA